MYFGSTKVEVQRLLRRNGRHTTRRHAKWLLDRDADPANNHSARRCSDRMEVLEAEIARYFYVRLRWNSARSWKKLRNGRFLIVEVL